MGIMGYLLPFPITPYILPDFKERQMPLFPAAERRLKPPCIPFNSRSAAATSGVASPRALKRPATFNRRSAALEIGNPPVSILAIAACP